MKTEILQFLVYICLATLFVRVAVKTEFLQFLVCICLVALFVHVTVTPFTIAHTPKQLPIQTELVCDSVKPSNAEIYEIK